MRYTLVSLCCLVTFGGLAGCASEGDLPDIGSQQQQALPTQPDGDPGCIDDTDCGTCKVCNRSTGLCGNASSLTVCRASAGPCDPAERCSAGTCPANTLSGTSVVCRAGGECNPQETCTGSSAACPTDLFTGSGVGCTSDSNACTTDACNGAGACAHTTVTCPGDTNPCTDTTCSPTTGCGNTAKPDTPAFACNDNLPCTLGDVCVGGTCRGTARVCDDTSVCTTDSCNPSTGACVFTPVANSPIVSCNDGSNCTSADRCVAGICTGDGTICPDDGNQCTTSMCGTSGCSANTPLPAGTLCNADNDLCTDRDSCVGTTCTAGTRRNCDDNNPCTADSCNPLNGVCVNAPANEGGTCSDGNACTSGDVCTAGACTPGAPASCDDNNSCTVDACNTSTGCTHDSRPTSTSCDDGNVCTTSDTCQANGSCSGDQIDCDDMDPSTADSCQAGTCIHSTSPGGDGGTSAAGAVDPGQSDGGTTPADEAAGCGCRTHSRNGLPGSGLLLGLAFALVIRSRRRR